MSEVFRRIEQINNPSLNFLADARAKTFAGNVNPMESQLYPDTKELQYLKNGLFYRDSFWNRKGMPGRIAGLEELRKNGYDGVRVGVYSYGGGLTEAGLALDPEEAFGVLRTFLLEYSKIARFGRNMRVIKLDKNENDVWMFENHGQSTEKGWKDYEVLSKNRTPIHEIFGNGVFNI